MTPKDANPNLAIVHLWRLCNTMTILTWPPGNTKDISSRLCLFTLSTPILCSSLWVTHILTLVQLTCILRWYVNLLRLVIWNEKNTRETIKRHTYIVWATQDMPTTQLSLIIANQLQYEHYRLGLQLGRVTRLASPHQDTHTNICHTKTPPSQQLLQLLHCTPDTCPPQTHWLLSIARLHIDLWFCIIACLT